MQCDQGILAVYTGRERFLKMSKRHSSLSFCRNYLCAEISSNTDSEMMRENDTFLYKEVLFFIYLNLNAYT